MARPVVSVFGSSSTQESHPDWADAVRLGRLLADHGFDVATGGYGGTMEAVSRGAAAGGARVIGVTAPDLFPYRQGPNRFVTQERPAATLLARIETLTSIAQATIALPGSLGTFTELMVAWNDLYLRQLVGGNLAPAVAVGSLWSDLVLQLTAQLRTPDGLVVTVDTVDAAVGHVVAAFD